MWQIGNPAYGWALLALLIPIVVHLYNRQQTKVKILGSLRWVTAVQPARWHFRRIHQWPLLLIRSLLFIVLVLLLMNISWTAKSSLPDQLHALILIHPAAGDTLQYRQLASGWQNDSVQVRWLAPGFPFTHEAIRQRSDQQVMSLVAEADWQFRPDSIHVIAPNRLMYFTGSKPPTSAPLSWELTDMAGDSIRLLWAAQVNDTLELLWFRTNASQTQYWLQKGISESIPGYPQANWLKEKQAIQVTNARESYEVPLTSPDTLVIGAVWNASQSNAWQTFQAAIQAIANYHSVAVQFVDTNTAAADWLVYFSNNSATAASKNPFKLSYQPNAGTEWLEPVQPDSVVIRKALTTGQILEGGLIEALRPYILAFKFKQVVIPGVDYRQTSVASQASAEKVYQAAAISGKTPENWRMYLGLLALVLMITERIWPKKIK